MTLSHDIGLIIAIIIIITIITLHFQQYIQTIDPALFILLNNKNDEQKNNKQTQTKKINIKKKQQN